MLTSGIYKICHIDSGKVYIGSSKNVFERMTDHRSALKSMRHKNPKLLQYWWRYGPNAFTFEPILFCDRKDLEFYEQLCIDGFGSYYTAGGFNLRPKAFVNTGRKGSEIQKAVTTARLTGVKNPAFSEFLKTPERAAASRAQLNGFRQNKEIEKKRSEAIKRANAANPELAEIRAVSIRGKKKSAEVRARMSEARKLDAARRKAAGYVVPRCSVTGRITAAKSLSETPTGAGSALSAVAPGIGGQ